MPVGTIAATPCRRAHYPLPRPRPQHLVGAHGAGSNHGDGPHTSQNARTVDRAGCLEPGPGPVESVRVTTPNRYRAERRTDAPCPCGFGTPPCKARHVLAHQTRKPFAPHGTMTRYMKLPISMGETIAMPIRIVPTLPSNPANQDSATAPVMMAAEAKTMPICNSADETSKMSPFAF